MTEQEIYNVLDVLECKYRTEGYTSEAGRHYYEGQLAAIADARYYVKMVDDINEKRNSMKRIVKEGPQLTGAQALDAIIWVLKDRIGQTGNPELGSYISGKQLAYQDILEIVGIYRAEKFDDDPTENPMKALAESKSYAI